MKTFKKMWDENISAVNKYLLDTTENNKIWYSRVNMDTGKDRKTLFGALDAFMPGLLALSGNVELAERVQESCFDMWNLHNIEPEMLDYKSMKAVSLAYLLRPENIESSYYLYKLTNKKRYLEMGKKMFNDIKKILQIRRRIRFS